MTHRIFPQTVLALALVALGASTSFADAAKDLSRCQTTVATEGRRYLLATTRSVDQCLKRVSKGVIASGASTADAATAAAKVCATALRKLRNTASPEKALGEKFVARVGAKCEPSVNGSLRHADADTWMPGATTLGAANVGAACGAFGGDGTIASFAAWRDCVRASVECEARQAIALQWPRALEYLAALGPAIAALPAGSATSDALAALGELDAALEGATDDDVPELSCGKTSGALLATGQTQCDQGDGTLGPCPGAVPGEDGETRAGVPSRYTDNGDGTISDRVTGLMWEKLVRDGSEHDVSLNAKPWSSNLVGLRSTSTPGIVLDLNGLPLREGFAGYTDWRMPNRRELESLVDLGRAQPAIDPVFDHDCAPGCNALQCSCTADEMWSSTATPDGSQAYVVSFADGSVVPRDKSGSYPTRGVRGGTIDPVVTSPVPLALDSFVRAPWRSSCVSLTTTGYDADAFCVIGLKLVSLPSNGFLTNFIDGGYAPGCEDIPGADTSAVQQPYQRFQITTCYVPFSSTFTGFDSFTFQFVDREGHVGNVATFNIEIFED